MKNSSENFRFQSLSAVAHQKFPFLSEAKILFGSAFNPAEIYVRESENMTEYLKLREDKFDIFAIKNRVISVFDSKPELKNKIQVGEIKFDHSTVYTMITFNH